MIPVKDIRDDNVHHCQTCLLEIDGQPSPSTRYPRHRDMVKKKEQELTTTSVPIRADGVEKEVETSSATKFPARPMIVMRHTACRSLIAVNIAPRAPRAGGEPMLTRGRV